MLGLLCTPYYPNTEEMQLLELLGKGLSYTEISGVMDISPECARQRACQLRLNLGAANNEQMMFEYGRYINEKEMKELKGGVEGKC